MDGGDAHGVDGQGNALIAKLETAIKQIEKGNLKTGTNLLEAFINQVNADLQAGTLEPNIGEPLIEKATAILAVIQ